MRFFRKSPDPEPEPAPHRMHHPWNPPEAELPAIVPTSTLLLGRSDKAAVAITGISAYTQGFEIFVTRLIRPGVPGFDEGPVPGPRRAAPGPRRAAPAGPRPFGMGQQSFQISLRLSDGQMVTSGRAHGEPEPPGPILRSRGGGGTSHFQLLRWWAWPLPPNGPLEFICRWPAYGITDARADIDAQLILDAARRSIRPWPEGEN